MSIPLPLAYNHTGNLQSAAAQILALLTAQATAINSIGGGGTAGGGLAGFALDGSDGDEGMWIPGPPGAAGASGATGPASQGPPGFALDGADADDLLHIPGQTGATGATGPQGIPGIGLDGADADDLLHIPGQAGSPGPVGPQGIPGIGLDGADADDLLHLPGPQGPAGTALAFSGGLTSSTTINDTATYTTGGITLAGQVAGASTVWRLRAQGQFVAVLSATSRNAQVAAFWGSTQLVAITAAVLASTAQTSNWQLEFVLTGIDTTHLWTTGFMVNEIASATSLAISVATPASTLVTSGAQALDLRFSMSVAVATDQWIVQSVTMERLK